VRFLILSIGVILGVALQATWLAWLNLPGRVTPDLILIMVISYGLLRGSDEGFIFGFLAGFFVDLLSGGIIGIGALSKMAAGFVAGLLEKTIFKDNLLIPLIAAFFGTLVFESFSVLMYMAFNSNYQFFHTLIFTILPLAFYNAIFAPLICFFLLKMEHFIVQRNSNL
jgi:rod shape-determining protein MreD